MLAHRQLHCLEKLMEKSAAHCNLAYAAQALFAATACKRSKPLSVQYGFALKTDTHMGQEGRTITAEFATYYIVSTYFPNSGKSGSHETRTQGSPNLFTPYRRGAAAARS